MLSTPTEGNTSGGGPSSKPRGRRRRRKNPLNQPGDATPSPLNTRPMSNMPPCLRPSQTLIPRDDPSDEGDDIIVYRPPLPQKTTTNGPPVVVTATPSTKRPPLGSLIELQPSQVLLKSHKSLTTSTTSAATNITTQRAAPAPKPPPRNQTEITSTGQTSGRNTKGQSSKNKRSRSKAPPQGDYPDVYWRAVEMEDLRCHPCFDPLPHSSSLKGRIREAKDLSLYRQSSWQWDALHQGRVTTSRLAGALGFHETATAALLGMPPSLVSRGKAAMALAHLLEGRPAGGYIALVQDEGLLSGMDYIVHIP